MREAELLARDHWTRDELLAYQEERVRALITHAVTRSPYYREVLGAERSGTRGLPRYRRCPRPP
jgi:phenylacetate-coenzyme A ligase PaaK-like adenylate-forming protein